MSYLGYVNLKKLDNGDLELIVPDDDKIVWDKLLKLGSEQALWDLMEYWIGNGWDIISHTETGDTTWITDDTSMRDDGTKIIYGNVWMFADYYTKNPIEELRDHGHVVFERVYKEGELVPFQYTPKGRAIRNLVTPHGMCKNTCVEHARDKSVPSCKPRRARSSKGIWRGNKLSDGWHPLPCGGAVKIEGGLPVRVSDGATVCQHDCDASECDLVMGCAHDCIVSGEACQGADANDVLRDAEAVCGYRLTIGEWSGHGPGETDATASVRRKL